MNVKQAVALITKHRPSTPKEFNEAGVKLDAKPIGVGVFREVVKVKGLPLVVKFPLADTVNGKLSYRDGKMHSTVEVRKIRKLAKIRWLRQYLPKVYYHDRKTGVLVMHWYKDFEDDLDTLQAIGRMVTKLLAERTGVTVSDIHENNVRMGKSKKHAILIDLGY